MKVSENELRLIDEKEKLEVQIYTLEKSISNYYIERLAPWVYTFFVLLFGVIVACYNKENIRNELFFVGIINYVWWTWFLYWLLYLFHHELFISFLDKIIKFGISKGQYELEKEKLNKLYSELHPITDKLYNINISRIVYNEYILIKETVIWSSTLRKLNTFLENLENNLYTVKYGCHYSFEDDLNDIKWSLKMEEFDVKNNLERAGISGPLNSTQDSTKNIKILNNRNQTRTDRTRTNVSNLVEEKKYSPNLIENNGKILPLNFEKPNIQPSHKFDTVKHVKNIEIGELGELFVIEQEKKRLISAGRSDLAQKITHISKEFGDSAGFDVLSYNINGDEKMIEVKTTEGNISDDFFLTENEYRSMNINDNYYIYRVFNYSKEENTGQIKEIHCLSDKNQLNINISSYFVKPNILKSN